MAAPLDVALAVVRRGDEVLLQVREKEPSAGCWELPGGKVLSGEAPSQAALREACEELGVHAVAPRWLLTRDHDHPGGLRVRLHVFEVEADTSHLVPGPAWRWVHPGAVADLPVLEGTRPILAALAALAAAATP